jgi:hypothetical protein
MKFAEKILKLSACPHIPNPSPDTVRLTLLYPVNSEWLAREHQFASMDELKIGPDCLTTTTLMKQKRLQDIADKLYQHNWLFLGKWGMVHLSKRYTR